MVNGRVRILFRKRGTLYRPRRTGERKRKSARGCICGPDLAVIALKVLVKGDADVPGLTDSERPRRLGPKKVSAIRKAFALRKKDDVRKYVVRRAIEADDTLTGARKTADKTFYKSPKIQRLVTEKRIRRKKINKKRMVEAWKAGKENHMQYEKVLSKFLKEKKAAAKKEAADAAAPKVTKEAAEKKPKVTSKGDKK